MGGGGRGPLLGRSLGRAGFMLAGGGGGGAGLLLLLGFGLGGMLLLLLLLVEYWESKEVSRVGMLGAGFLPGGSSGPLRLGEVEMPFPVGLSLGIPPAKRSPS